MKKFALIALVLVAAAASAQAVSTATFSVTTSGTNWYLYATVDNQVNGLASFQIDLLGTGGTAVTSSTLLAPAYNALGTFAATGFQMFTSGGVVAGGSVTGIQAGQATVYGDLNVPANDAKVIQGIGQIANTVAAGFQGATWGVPCLLASGTFTGAGTFTSASLTGSLLSKVSGGAWVGPGNVEAGNFVFTPEPCTMSLLVIGGIGALLRRRAA